MLTPARDPQLEHGPPAELPVPPAKSPAGEGDSVALGKAHAAAQAPPPAPSLLKTGDQVAINRPEVHGRAWMARSAPSRILLTKGTQAELLDDPVRSGPFEWVKLRPAGSEIVCYTAVRYLDLVEAGFASAPLTPAPTEQARIAGPYQAGDLLVTSARLNLRSGAGKGHAVVAALRPNMAGMVLGGPVFADALEWLPARFGDTAGWIAAQYVRRFAGRERWIEVNLSTQTLTAWDHDVTASSSLVSTGKPGFNTPPGIYTISSKHPTRRVQATVRGETWDIPGVPWIMVFRGGGFYLHGVYWHEDFGAAVSHGCVTLPVSYAEWLYDWTRVDTPLWIHTGAGPSIFPPVPSVSSLE